MNNKFNKLTSTVFLVLFIFNSILSAQEITSRVSNKLESRAKQKTKLFVGLNYENYRTSFYSKETSRNNKIIDSTLSTVNEVLPRFHLKLTFPFNDSKLFSYFIIDMMIPFSTKEQKLDIFSLNSSFKKFNVLELDIGIEFEF